MKFKLHLCFVLIISWVLVSCDTDPEELVVAVESLEETAVATAVAVVPTNTATSTETPLPTQTLPPTPEPSATSTPSPTNTPTAMVAPTDTSTPIPTDMPTNMPTATTMVTLPPATPTPAGGLALLLRDEINQTIQGIDQYKGAIVGARDRSRNVMIPSDCQVVVNGYDRATSVLELNVSSSDPVIQGAYAEYRAAIDQFIILDGTWAQDCRDTLAAGETHRAIGAFHHDSITQNADNIKTVLYNARLRLSEFMGIPDG